MVAVAKCGGGSEEGWGVNELFSCLLEHVSTHICRKGSRRTSSGKPTLLCDVCNTVPTNSSHAQVTLTIAGLFFFGRCLLVGVEWCELDGGGVGDNSVHEGLAVLCSCSSLGRQVRKESNNNVFAVLD